jgi:hypothetical protein
MSGSDSGNEGGELTSNANMGGVRKKFHNGWTSELEDMMADWADKAACYRWMHEKTSIIYGMRDRSFNIPVIILSGVTAGANFALNSIFGDNDKENQKWAQLGLGGASLIAGIIQTLMNFYSYAKGSEAHRLAGISWGKFNRQLCIEMRMNPCERQDSIYFLKWFRTELDRLIEQSPIIPENIINQFNKMFKNADIVKPEITGILQHTRVFKDTGARLKRLAAEATINIHYKKGVIKQLVADDIERKTKNTAIEAARQTAREIIEEEKAKAKAAASAAVAASSKPKPVTFIEKQKIEREQELKKLNQKRENTVSELRNRFAAAVLGGVVAEGSPIPLPGMSEPHTFGSIERSIIVEKRPEPIQIPLEAEDILIGTSQEEITQVPPVDERHQQSEDIHVNVNVEEEEEAAPEQTPEEAPEEAPEDAPEEAPEEKIPQPKKSGWIW